MLELLSKEEIMSEYSLKKIIRYNHRTRLQDESVAEHTCFVSLFCLKIMAKLNLTPEQERQVLIIAALHDVPESKTSDIPYDVKENYPSIKDILGTVEAFYYKEKWGAYFGDIQSNDLLVQSIVKLADAYSVLQWCLNEKELGSKCSYLEDIIQGAEERIEKHTQTIIVLSKAEEKLKEKENGKDA